jgi:hypothetical protein
MDTLPLLGFLVWEKSNKVSPEAILDQVRVNTYDKSEVRQEAPGQEAGGKQEGIKEKIYYN